MLFDKIRTHIHRALLPLLVSLVLPVAASAMDLAQQRDFDIPAQDLSTALIQFSKQTGIQVIVAEDLTGDKAPEVKGHLPINEALNQLIRSTGLQFHIASDTSLSVSRNPNDHNIKRQDPKPLAQVDSRDSSSPPSYSASEPDTQGPASTKLTASASSKKSVEEVVITGSRLMQTEQDTAQPLHVYSRERIDRSGQSTVGDFLNTLPDVPVAVTESGYSNQVGSATTVRLHGLPLGSTLVLINGRRIETSQLESTLGFFDLNNIPLAAVERIEVISEGSSAVYGSDAIAGVVNIILKKNVNGLEANVRYGGATGIGQWDANIAAGTQWDRLSVSVIGSIQTRGKLTGSERALTADFDFRRFGGPDGRYPICQQANVYSVDGSHLPGVGAPYASVPRGFQGSPSQAEFAGTAGVLNVCNTITSRGALIPETKRRAIMGQANYDLTDSVSLFTELLYSRIEQRSISGSPYVFGEVGYQELTVSAANPYNPFGQTVGISGLLNGAPAVGRVTTTDFFRPLVGARGNLGSEWNWELAAWEARDQLHDTQLNQLNDAAAQSALDSSDPAVALNPFVDGPAGTSQQLRSILTDVRDVFSGETQAVNAFVRGPVLQLPSGAVQLVIGGEFDHDTYRTHNINDPYNFPGSTVFRRTVSAAFLESRIPIVGPRGEDSTGDVLAITAAGRFDKYNDFGSKGTPQAGLEWRPLQSLLVRGSYGKSFKAPNLSQLHEPDSVHPILITDPARGGEVESAIGTTGGNLNLKPESGQSHTVGIVFSPTQLQPLRLAVSQWEVKESNDIQLLQSATLLENEALFPGNVTRAPSQNGQPGPVTAIDAVYLNFGSIDVAGVDLELDYKWSTPVGELTPTVNATNTYKYQFALIPGVPAVDRVSLANEDQNFAVRWKASATLGWQLGAYSASLGARYVGRYRDYDPLPDGTTLEEGNFWFLDGNARIGLGDLTKDPAGWMSQSYVEIGGVNLLNRLPSYSNYFFGAAGFDPATSDIRGRWLYAQIHFRL